MESIGLAIVAVNVGNTRTGLALFHGKRLEQSHRVPNSDLDGIVSKLEQLIDAAGESSADPIRIVSATVNAQVSETILTSIASRSDTAILRIGRDLNIPIGRQLDPESIVGEDRLLNAAAAFDTLNQACVVIDAGTAVTVDFVDGQGTFHGGAIAPGCQLQLNALHSQTSLLPDLEFTPPGPEFFGANTQQAMLHGVFYGIRGMVRHLIERYAEAYEAYPAIIATGGDAHDLFDQDELIERIDDDLTLRGIAAACRLAIQNAESVGEDESEY